MEKHLESQKKPLFSIVVPIYKVAKYLPTFFECVINQTCNDFECILVDDGSPDECGVLCDQISSQQSHIKTIHKTNGGVSSARNIGIDNASGEWILFFDPDDTFEYNCIETLKHFVRKNGNIDFLIFNHNYCSDKGKIIDCYQSISEKIIPDRKELELYIRGAIVNCKSFLRSPWTKLYNTAIIKNNNLYFSGRTIAEDYDFNFRYFNKVKNGIVIDVPLYNYWLHPGTAISRYHSQALDIWLEDTSRELEWIYKCPIDNKTESYDLYFKKKLSSLAYILSAEQSHNTIGLWTRLSTMMESDVMRKINSLAPIALKPSILALLNHYLNRKSRIGASIAIFLFRNKIFFQNFCHKIFK